MAAGIIKFLAQTWALEQEERGGGRRLTLIASNHRDRKIKKRWTVTVQPGKAVVTVERIPIGKRREKWEQKWWERKAEKCGDDRRHHVRYISSSWEKNESAKERQNHTNHDPERNRKNHGNSNMRTKLDEERLGCLLENFKSSKPEEQKVMNRNNGQLKPLAWNKVEKKVCPDRPKTTNQEF